MKSSKRSPKFTTCCNSGEIQLPLLLRPPEPLLRLLTSADDQSSEFRSNIRQYNAAMAFTSLGVKIDHSVTGAPGGPYVLRVNSEVCHRMGAFEPSGNESPSYAQLYLYDPQTALDQRMRRNRNLRNDTMNLLQTTLRTHHRYATLYQHAYEVLSQQPDVQDISIRLRITESQDHRRYNLPLADEIAVIIPGDGSEVWDNRDIIVCKRDDGMPLRRVNDGHPSYACLHYVLLFPYGEDGWHWKLKRHQPDREDPKHLSQSRFYSFRLHPRPAEFSTILHAGRLCQQYIVDAWAQIEQNRLSYLRHNQSKLRASLYSGLEDAINSADGNIDVSELGQRYILPSSHYGSPHHMQQCLQDALALARFFRKIDLFITMTCNPQWPEITRELLSGQSPSDRPDLVARVFDMKKKALIKDIYKKGVFGQAVAYVYTIEFQKRGLPHMHLLIFLEQGSKMLTPEDIDTAISARWPDPETEPKLFDTVKKCMVHGPCGAANPTARCMDNGKCTKHYPKPFTDHTMMDEDGYPRYYCPNDGRAYQIGTHNVDNRWIVPHNPFMSSKYDCHINVESTISFASVKYVFKYVYKVCHP